MRRNLQSSTNPSFLRHLGGGPGPDGRAAASLTYEVPLDSLGKRLFWDQERSTRGLQHRVLREVSLKPQARVQRWLGRGVFQGVCRGCNRSRAQGGPARWSRPSRARTGCRAAPTMGHCRLLGEAVKKSITLHIATCALLCCHCVSADITGDGDDEDTGIRSVEGSPSADAGRQEPGPDEGVRGDEDGLRTDLGGDDPAPDAGPEDTDSPGDDAHDSRGAVPCTTANTATQCGRDGVCVDGFCCESACDGRCEACDVAGFEGKCSLRPPSVVCRDRTGPCDAVEFCDGEGSDCPADRLHGVEEACRPSAGPCDPAEYCGGVTDECPGDVVAEPGAACGSPDDTECTAPDTCDAAGSCLANHADAGVFCGDPTHSICDGGDTCDGEGACQDNLGSVDTVCRPPANECDAAEMCDGSGGCPDDLWAAPGTECGDSTDNECTDPDTCDGSGACLANHAEPETTCGGLVTVYRCGGGAECAAEPQSGTASSQCLEGACVAGEGSGWTTMANCSPDAICTSDASGARCDRCDTPPDGYCDGSDDAFTYASVGACAAGRCAYEAVGEACTGGCAVVGSSAHCTTCNDAMMAIPGAPLWGWETGDEGWNMGGDWERDDYRAHGGDWSMDFTFSFDYDNYEDDTTRWRAAHDLSLCQSCGLTVGFWLRGSTESCCDGLTLRCSGDGGTSWSDVGDRIDGYYSWTRFTRTLPESCITDRSRLALRFESDFSFVDEGYVVDDLRLETTATAPDGWLDAASATSARGWACDGDAWGDELTVVLRFFKNGSGAPLERLVHASQERTDLVDAGVCGSTPNHGWTLEYDDALVAWLGTGTHSVRAYGRDGPAPCGAGEYELPGSPQTFSR